jgi:hypothetical protein
MAAPKHPRAEALRAILTSLNLWAMAPDEPSRVRGLKAALRGYQQDVRALRYPPMDRYCASKTPACNTEPPILEGSFEFYFGCAGEAVEATAGASEKLPWED